MRQGKAGQTQLIIGLQLELFVQTVGAANQQRHIAAIQHPGFKPASQLERRQVVAFFIEHDKTTTRGQSIADTTLFSRQQLLAVF